MTGARPAIGAGADRVVQVPPDQWLAAARAERSAGFAYLDLFAGVDRLDAIEVVVRLVRLDPAPAAVRLSTRVPPGSALASLAGLFPAAAWHERELAELFGVDVDGLGSRRPLLRRQRGGAPELLKSTVLAARVARPWPGSAADADDRRGSRRRLAPPGVAADWLLDVHDEQEEVP